VKIFRQKFVVTCFWQLTWSLHVTITLCVTAWRHHHDAVVVCVLTFVKVVDHVRSWNQSTVVLYPVYTIQPVVKLVWQPAEPCKQTSNRLSHRLSNGFDNRLNVCIHDRTGCQTGLIQVVSCKWGLSFTCGSVCVFSRALKWLIFFNCVNHSD